MKFYPYKPDIFMATCEAVKPEVVCKRCGGTMKPGTALVSTYTGTPDFPGGGVVTMSPGGPGRLVDCVKCSACGWSRFPVETLNGSQAT